LDKMGVYLRTELVYINTVRIIYTGLEENSSLVKLRPGTSYHRL